MDMMRRVKIDISRESGNKWYIEGVDGHWFSTKKDAEDAAWTLGHLKMLSRQYR
jgi:hypothetical protein